MTTAPCSDPTASSLPENLNDESPQSLDRRIFAMGRRQDKVTRAIIELAQEMNRRQRLSQPVVDAIKALEGA